MTTPISRRALLGSAAVAGAAVLGGGVLLDRLGGPDPVEVGAAPDGLPLGQHMWDDHLAADAHGNPRLPQFARFLLFDLTRGPDRTGAARIEAVCRTLERRFAWDTGGLLFTLGWGPSWFARVTGAGRAPIPVPQSLAAFEVPQLDDFSACLHLASDDEQTLAEVEDALTDGATLEGADGPTDLRPVLTRQETRTGFAGSGLPAARQEGVAGIPSGCPVRSDAPLFMGFKSAFRGNQATEESVTIEHGPLAGGTTMHLSRLSLGLDSWYGPLSREQRAARMYAPQLTLDEVDGLTDAAPTFAAELEQTARDEGLVGHAQATAGARRNGRPIILRRDVDSVDDEEAAVHFASLQADIADFVATRTAMNAAGLSQTNPNVQQLVNNGINEWVRVTHRANFLVPPRPQRAFPLWS